MRHVGQRLRRPVHVGVESRECRVASAAAAARHPRLVLNRNWGKVKTFATQSCDAQFFVLLCEMLASESRGAWNTLAWISRTFHKKTVFDLRTQTVNLNPIVIDWLQIQGKKNKSNSKGRSGEFKLRFVFAVWIDKSNTAKETARFITSFCDEFCSDFLGCAYGRTKNYNISESAFQS